MKGQIFSIQRFSTQDGPGIRTTVFLKGCPLRCLWCHNPESGQSHPELFYDENLCVGCRRCASVCPSGCHLFEGGAHVFARESCRLCFSCSSACPTGALTRCGEEKKTSEVLSVVRKDAIFYRQSGGGMTLSGGEPLMQYDFSLSLLRDAKAEGISTAVETCGYCSRDLTEINRFVDLWLFDLKLTDREEHFRCTGVFPDLILSNLSLLDRLGASVILRCPILPGINLTDEHFSGIASLVSRLSCVKEIQFEPYHPLGVSKSRRLGKEPSYSRDDFLNREEVLPFADRIRDKVSVEIKVL